MVSAHHLSPLGWPPRGSSVLCPGHSGRRVLLSCCSSCLLAPHSLLAPHTLPCVGRWRIQRRPPFFREMNGEDPAWPPGSHPAAHSRRPIPRDASWTPFPSLEPVHRGSWDHALLSSHGHHTVHVASLPTQTPALASAGALHLSPAPAGKVSRPQPMLH